MKQLVNLAERQNFVPVCFMGFNPNGMVRERIVREDGSYTLSFIDNPIPELKGLSFQEKAVLLRKRDRNTQRAEEVGYIVSYRGPKDMCFAVYNKTLCQSGRQIYIRKKWDVVIRFDGTKVIMSKTLTVPSVDYLFSLILQFFGVEGIENDFRRICNKYHPAWRDSTSVIHRVLKNKQVLKGIFSQRITNSRQAFSTFLASSYKLKPGEYNFDETLIYLEHVNYVNLLLLKEFTTNLRESIRLLSQHYKIYHFGRDIDRERDSYEILSVFSDLTNDCAVLDKKMNPSCSLKRMHQEHSKFTHERMILERGTMSDTPIYDLQSEQPDFSEFGIEGQIINNEMDAFEEGETMHHCIYTCYFSKIKNREYIGLSINYPERITVGIRANSARQAYIEQMHTIRNGVPSKDSQERIEKFFEQHKDFFTGLLDTAKNTQVSEQVPAFEDDDLPY